MPFQSEKQRRYMHANLPDIANRWEAKYGLGGIAELNSQLNSLPEYYLPKNQGGRIGYEDGTISPALKKRMLELLLQGVPPHKLKEEAEKQLKQDPYIKERMNIPGSPVVKEAAHGGFIPSHQAGIYGLEDGGKIIEGQPHQLSYITPDEAQTLQNLGGKKVMTPEGIPAYPPQDDWGGPSYDGGNQNDGGNQGSDHGHSRFEPGSGYYGEPVTTTTTTTGGDGPDPHGNWGTTEEHLNKIQQTELKNFVNQQEKNWGKYDNPLDKYSYTPQGVINRENLKQQQALDNWNQVKNTANTWAKKKAGKAVFDHFLLGGATFGLSDVIGGLMQGFKTNKAKQEFIEVIKGSIGEYQKLGFAEHSPHKDTLIQDLNQQLLDLTQTRDRPDQGPEGPNGGDDVTGIARITYDDIEDTNKKELASAQWRLAQEKVDRSKQLAYWRMMMEPYMSAQGGRVPQGYNTGGLSNLFRLKNR